MVEARVQWRPVYRKGNQWRDAAALLRRPVRDAAREKARLVKPAGAGAGG